MMFSVPYLDRRLQASTFVVITILERFRGVPVSVVYRLVFAVGGKPVSVCVYLLRQKLFPCVRCFCRPLAANVAKSLSFFPSHERPLLPSPQRLWHPRRSTSIHHSPCSCCTGPPPLRRLGRFQSQLAVRTQVRKKGATYYERVYSVPVSVLLFLILL